MRINWLFLRAYFWYKMHDDEYGQDPKPAWLKRFEDSPQSDSGWHFARALICWVGGLLLFIFVTPWIIFTPALWAFVVVTIFCVYVFDWRSVLKVLKMVWYPPFAFPSKYLTGGIAMTYAYNSVTKGLEMKIDALAKHLGIRFQKIPEHVECIKEDKPKEAKVSETNEG